MEFKRDYNCIKTKNVNDCVENRQMIGALPPNEKLFVAGEVKKPFKEFLQKHKNVIITR